jgi:hypothetical protein
MSSFKVKCVLLAVLFLASCGSSKSFYSNKILIVSCDGARYLLNGDGTQDRAFGKLHLGDVQRGYLFGNRYIFMADSAIYSVDFASSATSLVANVRGSIDNGYLPCQIGYADNNSVYFSAYFYDRDVSVGKQNKQSFIYYLDVAAGKVNRLNINNCASPYFSVHNGKVYYEGGDGYLYEFKNNSNRSIGVRGRYPCVSFDGNEIAYSSFGVVYDSVYVHGIESGRNIRLIKFLGPNVVNPIIRWSKDGNCILVAAKSDLTGNSLYVADARKANSYYKIKKGRACNWFFADY